MNERKIIITWNILNLKKKLRQMYNDSFLSSKNIRKILMVVSVLIIAKKKFSNLWSY